ncbi:hypothetical protein GALL_482560 [mine drainage metagenome]|uniref:Uncharacterized protein n=1 Tax=mine drainage metagenome TaxID=410659 RepID=A0A1J5PET6_9ZZZZ
MARLLADPRFAEPLRQLDRACSTGAPWQGQSLAQAFAQPPQPVSAQGAKPVIPDLYA